LTLVRHSGSRVPTQAIRSDCKKLTLEAQTFGRVDDRADRADDVPRRVDPRNSRHSKRAFSAPAGRAEDALEVADTLTGESAPNDGQLGDGEWPVRGQGRSARGPATELAGREGHALVR